MNTFDISGIFIPEIQESENSESAMKVLCELVEKFENDFRIVNPPDTTVVWLEVPLLFNAVFRNFKLFTLIIKYEIVNAMIYLFD